MCGIGLRICPGSSDCCTYKFCRFEQLKRRGPDAFNEIVVQQGKCHIHFASAVLNLRGKSKTDVTVQPLTDKYGNILLFNGEIYSFSGNDEGNRLDSDDNDAMQLSKILEKRDSIDEVLSALSSLVGPWSIIYLMRKENVILLGRDRCGRRSLLEANKDSKLPLTYCSVSLNIDDEVIAGKGWERVGAGKGMFKISFNGPELRPVLIPWNSPLRIAEEPEDKGLKTELLKESFPAHVKAYINDSQNSENKLEVDKLYQSALHLLNVLDKAVRIRVNFIPEAKIASESARIAILFSGGLDCTVLAALASRHVAKHEPIDLLNVCFSKDHRSPDRIQAIESVKQLREVYRDREWNLVHIDASFDDVLSHEKSIFELCFPSSSHMDFNIGAALWFASKGEGYLVNAYNESVEEDHMTHFEHLFRPCGASESSMEKKRKECPGTTLKSNPLLCTYKPTCSKVAKSGCLLQACKSCCRQNQKITRKRCKSHKLKKQEIEKYGITFEETKEETLDVAPHLDCWEKSSYVSTAQVLLNGLGADEQLGGYGRHRGAFLYRGWKGLEEEICMDVDRLWSRNLGRDDRCVSDHGKEVRHPYLDEDVMHALRYEIPLQHLVNYSESRSVGDKRLLRIVSHMLGMTRAACYEKRAIQFGTKLAKLSNIRAFGSNRAFSGDAEYVVAKSS